MAEVKVNATTSNYEILMVVARGIEDSADKVISTVKNGVYEALEKELKPEIANLIKENLSQIVKELGQELVVKGLRQLVSEDSGKKSSK